MKTLILNDQHFGVRRMGGATKESRVALDEWMLSQFKKNLSIPHDQVIILGDLCDSRNISEHIMIQVIELLSHEDAYVVLGNHCLGGVHDHSMSSCEFIGELSDSIVIRNPTTINEHIHIIPHMFNQEAHEEAVKNCPDTTFLLTHCNINNSFAVGDHSLNLSNQELDVLDDRGIKVIAAHEHGQRSVKNVTVIGSQCCSSIADCLTGDRRALILDGDSMESVPTWSASDDYIELDYRELTDTGHKFIRVNGNCKPVEFPGIVRDVAKLRKDSDAFIIANNVQVEVAERETVSLDEVTGFNILELLMDNIDEEFKKEVGECI